MIRKLIKVENMYDYLGMEYYVICSPLFFSSVFYMTLVLQKLFSEYLALLNKI